VRPRPRIVAGLDVSYASEQFGAATCTAVDIKTGRLLWSETVTRKIGFPYISSFLTFRELPILLDLLDATMTFEPCPDWFLVDGSGIIHPQGAGVATMLGVLAGVPTVGITKKRLFGRVDTSGMRPGMSRAVMDGRRKLGVAIRLRTGTERPLFVSPGHGVSVAAAERIVRRDFHPKSIAGAARTLYFSCGGGLVAPHRLQAVSAGLPETCEVRGFAQVFRHEPEQWLGTLVPEFLSSFHTAVDLLDG